MGREVPCGIYLDTLEEADSSRMTNDDELKMRKSLDEHIECPLSNYLLPTSRSGSFSLYIYYNRLLLLLLLMMMMLCIDDNKAKIYNTLEIIN